MPPHLSAVPTRSKGIQGITFGVGLAAGVTGKLSLLTANHLWGSTSGFLSGFNSVAFSVFGYEHKAVVMENQGFPSPRRTTLLGCRAPSTSNDLSGNSCANVNK